MISKVRHTIFLVPALLLSAPFLSPCVESAGGDESRTGTVSTPADESAPETVISNSSRLKPVPYIEPIQVGTGDEISPTDPGGLPSLVNKNKPGEIVWYDTKKRRVYVKGRFCLDKGVLEYVVVAGGGKTHEAVVEISCVPLDLAYAMLACRFPFSSEFSVKKTADGKTARFFYGQAVDIFFEYEQDGVLKRRCATDFIWNGKSRRAIAKAPFIFTGSGYAKDSRTGKTYFKADYERSIAGVFFDFTALLNTPLNTGADDTYYMVNKKTVPPRNTPVLVIFQPAARNRFTSEELEDNAGLAIVPDAYNPFRPRVAGLDKLPPPPPKPNTSIEEQIKIGGDKNNKEDELDKMLDNLDGGG